MKPIFANDSSISAGLEIRGMQLQPFFGSGQSKSFGYSWDCEPVFSVGTWQAIIVSAILIGVVAWGIDMFVKYEPLQKFDDPHSKPLQVPLDD